MGPEEEGTHIGHVADWIVQTWVHIMECEEVDGHAGFGCSNHHVPAIGSLAIWEPAPIIANIVSYSWSSYHGVRITVLYSSVQHEGIMRMNGSRPLHGGQQAIVTSSIH